MSHPFENHPYLSNKPVAPDPGVDIVGNMVRQSTIQEIRGYEKRRKIPFKDLTGKTLAWISTGKSSPKF